MSRRRGFGPGWSWQVLPAPIYLVVTFVSGSLPSASMGPIEFRAQDKIIHLFGFWLMQWTHARAWRFVDTSLPESKVLVRSVWTATIAGGLLEIWQSFLPHRSADVFDWLADAVGAALGAVVASLVARARRDPGGAL